MQSPGEIEGPGGVRGVNLANPDQDCHLLGVGVVGDKSPWDWVAGGHRGRS